MTRADGAGTHDESEASISSRLIERSTRVVVVADHTKIGRTELAVVAPLQAVDTVVIAGMGGDNIASILDAAAWVHDPRYTLILQPQTSGNDLRRYLGRAGFSIEAEALVRDGGFLYFTILARFGGGTPLTPGQQYLSPQLLRSGDPLLPAYFDRILNALERTVAGITAGGDEKKLDYYQRALDEVREMRRHYDRT